MNSTPSAWEYGFPWKVGLCGDQVDIRSLDLSIIHMAAVLMRREAEIISMWV